MSKWRVNEPIHVTTVLREHGPVDLDFEAGDITAAPGSLEDAALEHIAQAVQGDDERPAPVELLEADPPPDPYAEAVVWDSTSATIAEVLEHVGGDATAAATALAAEEQASRPRQTLIAKLAEIVNPGSDA